MQANTKKTVLSAQPSASTISSYGKVVELSGYVIIVVENVDGKVKLYGSPPDRDNLEVGDEILEVNGLLVENISRTEIIRHIHDCIKSCTICLRVRKKADSKLARDIGNSIQDAFLIAVEEHARERLQRLAALNRVNPVDITQLSKKLQQSKSSDLQTQDLSFLQEASPIYVTSLTNTHTNSTVLASTNKANTTLTYVHNVKDTKINITGNDINDKRLTTEPATEAIKEDFKDHILENEDNDEDSELAARFCSINYIDYNRKDPQSLGEVRYSGVLSSCSSSQTYIPVIVKNQQIYSENKNNLYYQTVLNQNTNTNIELNADIPEHLKTVFKKDILENTVNTTTSSTEYSTAVSVGNINSSLVDDRIHQEQFLHNKNNNNSLTYTQAVILNNNNNINNNKEIDSIENKLANQNSLIRSNNQTYTGEIVPKPNKDANKDDDVLNTELHDIRQHINNNYNQQYNSISKGRTEILLGDQTLRQDIRPRRRSGSSIVVINSEDLKPCFNEHSNNVQVNQQEFSESQAKNLDMLTMISMNDDNGPHREMAVDCPDSFIARNKTPPRYPPPRPPQFNGSIKTESKRDLRDMQNFEIDNNFTDKRFESSPPELSQKASPPVVHRSHQQSQHIAHIVEPTLVQLDSIKKYQEQLKRRREEEERIAQQNEFLRASLRGSQKLKALQNNCATMQETSMTEQYEGVENNAYIDDEEKPSPSYNDLLASLTILKNQLTKYDKSNLAARIAVAYNLLSNTGIARAFATRQAIMQQRFYCLDNSENLEASELQRDIVELLAQSNSSSAIELGNILSSHELEGLLMAHDQISQIADTIYNNNNNNNNNNINNSSNSMRVQKVPLPLRSSLAPPSVPNKNNNNNNNNNNISATLQNVEGSPMIVPRMMAPLPPKPTKSQNIINMNTMPIQSSAAASMSTCFGTLNDQNDNIRIIQIEKSTEPLGATVRNEGEAVVIGRIVRGGAAEKSGLLHEGDEILDVNGQELRGKTVNEVCALLSGMSGTLTFLIVQNNNNATNSGHLIRENAVLHVRSHFDYDPEDDLYIPCRELGISFQKGDVLHVISREDPNWWQAYREGEEDQTLAGLIPSQSFQHQREAMKLSIAEEAGLTRSKNKDGGTKGSTLLCARKGRKKKKKASSEAGYPLYATTAPDETDPDEILTYEEVALYYPRATHKRPIVLIGPPNIGRHELRQRLMADSDRFSAAVPHTSRARREGEVPGVDYHFITRQAFEADILARRFVEHGEYEKAYYGTSLEAIRAVVASGKICVLNLHPQSLKLLRSSDLKPYVVLVAPPSLDKLRQKKIRNGEPFKEDELKDIIATARDMEARWGHLFDMIIINNDTERAYHQLLAEINSLEREPQWVPASWVHSNEC